jgi:rod shape-determining protein MreC
LINAGERDGVRKNQIVINQQGVVGRIIETGEKTARILLLTDLNSKIPVITSESRERCIAAGDNSEVIKILYLPGDNKVKVGEQVFTSGDGDMFPADLQVGTIYAMTDKAFYIKPSVEWSRLGYVQVVRGD